MKDIVTTKKIDQWEQLLEERREEELISLLVEAPEIEVAEFLSKLTPRTLLRYLSLFEKEKQYTIFSYLDEERWDELYHYIPREAFSLLFSNLPSDLRADFYQKLSDKEQVRLLPFLNKKVREDVIMLSAYPPETAGGIMNTDFATIRGNMTAKSAIAKLREDAPSKKMIYYLYVVNAGMQMIGFVSLKKLIMADPDEMVKDLLHDKFIHATVYEDRESVAQKIEKYDLMAIPILNEEGQLAGIVSYDDAMDVIREEQTEDMEKFMGIVSAEEGGNYLTTSSWQHFKKRIGWIVGLFVASFLSGYILHQYEHTLQRITLLFLYIPMINDAGGNAGSQSATVVIRALSLGQVTLRDWLVIIYKEAKVSLMVASCLFILAFFKVLVLSSGSESVDVKSLRSVALVISLAVSCQVISGTVIGATLPLIAKRFKGDPALAASPAITTLVDITGMLIYFSIATALLF